MSDLHAERDALSGGEAFLADSALPLHSPVKHLSLQHRLDPLVEATLTDIVGRLRSAWIANIAGSWTEICAVDIDALPDLDKRVATSLRKGFFHFAQLLCGLELLLLESKKLGLVAEQSVLGPEKLVVHLRNHCCALVEIADGHGGGDVLLRQADCGCRAGDQ